MWDHLLQPGDKIRKDGKPYNVAACALLNMMANPNFKDDILLFDPIQGISPQDRAQMSFPIYSSSVPNTTSSQPSTASSDTTQLDDKVIFLRQTVMVALAKILLQFQLNVQERNRIDESFLQHCPLNPHFDAVLLDDLMKFFLHTTHQDYDVQLDLMNVRGLHGRQAVTVGTPGIGTLTRLS